MEIKFVEFLPTDSSSVTLTDEEVKLVSPVNSAIYNLILERRRLIKELDDLKKGTEAQLRQDFRKVEERVTLRLDDSRDLLAVLEYIVHGPGRRLVRQDIFECAYEAYKGVIEAKNEYWVK